MCVISNFKNCIEEGKLTWKYRGKDYSKKLPGRVIGILTQDKNNIVIIYFYKGMDCNNALILNPNGSVKNKIMNPGKDDGAICFEDVYYVDNELTLIIAYSAYQLACVVDSSGKIIRTYETR